MTDFSFLFELEKQLHSFEVRSDISKISALLSPSFFEFGSSGSVWSLTDILERLPKEDGKTQIESYNYKASVLSADVVLVTYISRRVSKDDSSQEFLRSSVWRKNLSGWQMEFHQGTPKR